VSVIIVTENESIKICVLHRNQYSPQQLSISHLSSAHFPSNAHDLCLPALEHSKFHAPLIPIENEHPWEMRQISTTRA